MPVKLPGSSNSRGGNKSPRTANPPPDDDDDQTTTEQIEAWIERVVDDSDGNRKLKQIAIGGASGWLTGFVCMKATAIGGGILLLQIANHKGYIKINWNRVNRDFEQVSNKIQKEAFGKRKEDWSDKLERKAVRLANKQKNWFRSMLTTEDDRLNDLQYFAIAFSAGIGLGLIMGR